MAHLVYDQKERIGAWVAAQVNQNADWGSFYAIGVMSGDNILAGVVINNYNGANATCHIAIAQQTKAIIPLFQAVCVRVLPNNTRGTGNPNHTFNH